MERLPDEFIVPGTGSFVPALLVSAAIGPVSTLVYLLVIRAEPITSAELTVGTLQPAQ